MRNVLAGLVALVLMVIASRSLEAATVRVRVADPTGVGIPKILAIITSLEGKGEVWRGLTDDKGCGPALDEPAGLYEAIATDPYGPWFTKVVDFVAGPNPLVVELRLQTATVCFILATKVQVPVRIIRGDGQPASGAEVLARDPEAKYRFWAKADSGGRATLTVPLDGAEITTIYQGELKTQVLTIGSGLWDWISRREVRRVKALNKHIPELTVRLPWKPGTESAGINRHIVGDARALQERKSDSILTSSLAPVVVRRQAKRRQRHRWAGY